MKAVVAYSSVITPLDSFWAPLHSSWTPQTHVQACRQFARVLEGFEARKNAKDARKNPGYTAEHSFSWHN